MICTIADRIAGCLRGIAVGDAIGKQTESLSHGDVSRWYPDGVRGFDFFARMPHLGDERTVGG